MESGARQAGRAPEYELCVEFANSARQYRSAKHSRRAPSTCSRADYEKSDGQCHARFWLAQRNGNLRILDKNGELNNTSTYIGFAPQRKLGVVILVNRGKQHATPIGRQILHALAQEKSEPSTEGEPEPDID